LWIAERFGWSLEYTDALDWAEARKMIDILQSKDMAHKHNQRRAQMQADAKNGPRRG